MQISERDMVRFWKKVDRKGDSECWVWQGSPTEDGFGQFSIGYRTFLAHRVAYALILGNIPAGHIVWQSCGNRLCINPVHLRLSGNLERF